MRRGRFISTLAIGLLSGVAIGGLLWGPRLPLPESLPEAVTTVVKHRCGPTAKFGVPFNSSGLEKVNFYGGDRTERYRDPSGRFTVDIVRIGSWPREVACSISESGNEWQSQSRRQIVKASLDFGKRWTGSASRPAQGDHNFSELHLFRFDKKISPYVIVSTTASGERELTMITVGRGKFKETKLDA